jgi:hypothetical protein
MHIGKITAFALLSIGTITAKDKPTISIRVVETQSSSRHYSYDAPGTASQSTTNCTGNATATSVGNSTDVNGTTNCNTTTTPGTPSRRETIAIRQAHVLAVMPDGKHVTLWCQYGFRRCADLSAGSYTAELDGNSLYVYELDLSGKLAHRIKYQYAGGW